MHVLFDLPGPRGAARTVTHGHSTGPVMWPWRSSVHSVGAGRILKRREYMFRPCSSGNVRGEAWALRHRQLLSVCGGSVSSHVPGVIMVMKMWAGTTMASHATSTLRFVALFRVNIFMWYFHWFLFISYWWACFLRFCCLYMPNSETIGTVGLFD